MTMNAQPPNDRHVPQDSRESREESDARIVHEAVTGLAEEIGELTAEDEAALDRAWAAFRERKAREARDVAHELAAHVMREAQRDAEREAHRERTDAARRTQPDARPNDPSDQK